MIYDKKFDMYYRVIATIWDNANSLVLEWYTHHPDMGHWELRGAEPFERSDNWLLYAIESRPEEFECSRMRVEGEAAKVRSPAQSEHGVLIENTGEECSACCGAVWQSTCATCGKQKVYCSVCGETESERVQREAAEDKVVKLKLADDELSVLKKVCGDVISEACGHCGMSGYECGPCHVFKLKGLLGDSE